MEKIDQIVDDVIMGRLDTRCCPDIDAIAKSVKSGFGSVEDLKDALIRKREELIKNG